MMQLFITYKGILDYWKELWIDLSLHFKEEEFNLDLIKINNSLNPLTFQTKEPNKKRISKMLNKINLQETWHSNRNQ